MEEEIVLLYSLERKLEMEEEGVDKRALKIGTAGL